MHFETSNCIHVFDCDGVILDSNKMKVEAMRQTLALLDCPANFVDWAVSVFTANFGRTRRKHFEYFATHNPVASFSFDDAMLEASMKNYASKVMTLYPSCDVICETFNYISQLPAHNKIWVVSASDQSELRVVLPKKLAFFEAETVLGGPTSKVDNLNLVISDNPNSHIYFYGDAIQDAKASLETEVDFVGLLKYATDPESMRLFCEANNLSVYDHCGDLTN